MDKVNLAKKVLPESVSKWMPDNPFLLGKHAHEEIMKMNVSSGMRGFLTPFIVESLVLGYFVMYGLTLWFFTQINVAPGAKGQGKKILAKRSPLESIGWPLTITYALCFLLNLRLWWASSNRWWTHYNVGLTGNILGVMLGYAATFLLYETEMAMRRPTAKPTLSWNPALPRLLFFLGMALNVPYLGSIIALFMTAFLGFIQPMISASERHLQQKLESKKTDEPVEQEPHLPSAAGKHAPGAKPVMKVH